MKNAALLFKHISLRLSAILFESVDAISVWYDDDETALTRLHRKDLEFELRLQQYIEMIRQGGPDKQFSAMLHAKKYLVPFTDNRRETIMDAAGMMAQVPNTSLNPYKKLFARRLWVQEEVSAALDIRDIDHY